MPTKIRMAGQERREAIIEAAVNLFAQRGFRGTTTREIAAAVGVTEPVLYQHFATKRDLYTAIIDWKSQEAEREYGQQLEAAAQANDDRQYLTALATIILHWYTEDPAFVRLLLYSGLEGHEIAALCYERLGVRLDCEIVRHLQRRIEEGALRNGLDPLIAARAFLCMVAHFAQSRVVFRLQKEEISVDEYLRTMVDIFLRGITKN